MYNEMSSRTRRRLDRQQFPPRAGQVRIEVKDDDDEPMMAWAQEPDEVISVPALGQANRYFGLSLGHMWDDFTRFERDDSRYRMISASHSCAGVASRALVAGGAEAFGAPPGRKRYLLPDEVAHYARKIQPRITALNNRCRQFEVTVVPELRSNEKPRFSVQHRYDFQKDRLWSKAVFKERSTQRGHARMGGNVAIVDRCLGELDGLCFEAAWQQCYPLLVEVMTACLDSIDKKGPAHRNWAYAVLASQCLNVVRSPRVRVAAHA